jgi:hypothetical protein
MNTKTNAPPSADLEETAELPQLSPSMAAAIDPLSATDAWRAPHRTIPPRSREPADDCRSSARAASARIPSRS